MKNTFTKNIILWTYIVCLGYMIPQLRAQESSNSEVEHQIGFDISTLKTPDFSGRQTIKALLTISPYGKENEYVTRTSEGITIEELATSNVLTKNQFWWLVQDYKHQAFALVSVTDGTDWLYLQEDSDSQYSLTLTTNDKEEEEYTDDNYFFEFVMPYITQEEKHYIIQSIAVTDQNWKTEGSKMSSASLELNDSATFTFTFTTFRSFENSYIPIPTYTSTFHEIEIIQNNTIGSEVTRITAKEDSTAITRITDLQINDNTAIIGSGDITVLKRGGAEDLFQVTFQKGAIAKLGLLDYNASKYTKVALQTPGSRKLVSGIEMNDMDEIYLFNKGMEERTGFEAGKPIIFGYDNGTFTAKQEDKRHTLTGVPTAVLLNGEHYSRLLSIVRKGSVDISYKPEAIIISGEDFGTEPLPKQHNTDPQFSFSPSNNNKTNHFDWRKRNYPIAFDNQGTPNSIYPLSPFYTANEPQLSPIASKNSANGTYLGGEDFSSIDGWEMIKMDFGYDQNGVPKENLRGEPYMVLYNRFTGTLRVFLYIHNVSNATNLIVSLVDKKTNTIEGEYRRPRLWSSYLNGKALDNPSLLDYPKLGSDSYSKSKTLFTSSESKFYYVDFTFNYDPCVCFFESNLQIKVHKMTQGTMQIVGKTMGGSIPAGAEGYDEWLAQSGSYLTGVLDTPFGDQSQTLGDISLQSLNEWGNTPWSNEGTQIIPGKKVKPWEREALRLEYEGTSVMSAGDFMSAAGSAAKSVGEALSIFGSGPKVVGEALIAGGGVMKGSGRAMKAQSIKMRLDNLRDEPDQKTTITFPPPQPSLVFSELAATGTLEIKSMVFDNVIITTPGSKHAEQAPIDYVNGSKGSFPYYNEPLGVFNLMFTPEVAVTVVQNQNNRFGVHARLKEKPYVTTNMDKVQGAEFGFFLANYVITTYNSAGYPMTSRRTKPHMIATGLDINRQLPTSLDITKFIEQDLLAINLKDLSENAATSALKKYITVTLEIDYMGLSGVGESGKQNGEIVRQSYDAITEFSYKKTSASISDLTQKAAEKAETDFGEEYQGIDNDIWEENYIITRNTEGFDTHMKTFCAQTVPSIQTGKSSNSKNSENGKTEDSNEAEVNDELSSELIAQGIIAYPNPSASAFTIQYNALDKGTIKMTVSDVSGRVLLSHQDNALDKGESKQARINLQDLKGMYLLHISFENGESYSTKLIKE